MNCKRLIASLPALLVSLALGSCTQASAPISDHWPHWAGGEPNNLPPRPGTPGYAEFIAHGQSGATAAPPAGSAGNNTVPPASPAKPPPDDAAARGGLY